MARDAIESAELSGEDRLGTDIDVWEELLSGEDRIMVSASEELTSASLVSQDTWSGVKGFASFSVSQDTWSGAKGFT